AVTHNAHGTHVGEHREILVHGALQMGLSDLVPENEVCQAQSVQFVLRHLADDPDGKARARERLAHDQILRQAQLPTKLTDLVLEEHPQG
ncbi:GIY-YIG nuclease superfamily protein, partial [Dysosmobacter welbionis]